MGGSLTFAESTPYFANNGLGEGAVTTLKYKAGEFEVEFEVKLHWVEWNEIEFETLEGPQVGCHSG